METAQLLCALCAAKGGSGAESTAAQTALSLTGLPGGQVDALGNAWVTFGAENGPHLLLEAHIDQIGMIVTHITRTALSASLRAAVWMSARCRVRRWRFMRRGQ